MTLLNTHPKHCPKALVRGLGHVGGQMSTWSPDAEVESHSHCELVQQGAEERWHLWGGSLS
jgi:hypothetical protein